MDSFPASDAPPWPATHAGMPSAAPVVSEMFRDVVQRIHDDVRLLSETIGERNDRSVRGALNLARAQDAIERRFWDARLPVKRRRVSEAASNIEAVVRGGERAAESVVVGAHYDSRTGSIG